MEPVESSSIPTSGLIVADRVGRVVHATDTELWAFFRENPMATIFDVIHPRDRNKAIDEYRSVADGYVLDRRMRVSSLRPTGEQRILEVLASASRDGLDVDGILLSYTDVTTGVATNALRSISRRIALSPLDETDSAIRSALIEAMEATELQSVGMWIPHRPLAVYTRAGREGVGRPALVDAPAEPFIIDDPILKVAISDRSPMILDRADDPVAFTRLAHGHADRLHRLVVVPLFAADRLEGYAAFGCESRAWAPLEHRMIFLETASELIAGALARQRTSSELQERAVRDPLTQLPNRRLLTERLDDVMLRIRRTHSWAALIVVDCDGFKDVNDVFGHQVGDTVLVSVAERLTSVCRTGELVARFGGDEFVVMVESDQPEATVVALGQRIVEVLDSTFEHNGSSVKMSASVGVAVHHGQGAPLDAATMFKRADLAMYKAKQQGKNRVVLFAEEMEAATRERFELSADLRVAIRRTDEIALWYQPVVDLQTLELVGHEALIRWQHPRRGVLLPASFIELAEESGQIIDLGWMLLEMALDQMRAWRATKTISDRSTIAVNLSVRQFMAPSFQATMESIITASLVPAELIELELTETVFADRATVVPRLEELRALGVKLAIDDFGTGYSSLAYLRDLPVDILKVDQSFIHRLGLERRDDALVSALVRVAQELGLETIAEGVETQLQVDRLREIHCGRAQGYFFGRPSPTLLRDELLAPNPQLPR
jgi:diguanylate cyclase (GGDEF)-like protein